MSNSKARKHAKQTASHRIPCGFTPKDQYTSHPNISDYFGANVFDFNKMDSIPSALKERMIEVSQSGQQLSREHAEIIAKAVTIWATSNGATHFCHWFQPLTGGSAEKHDSFLSLNSEGKPINKLHVMQLIQGEPDASSFPHGGGRSTFEARGYTSWDISSPMFLQEGESGKILCIPTAFVSYTGEALDIKTGLLRSNAVLSAEVVKFLHQLGKSDVDKVTVNCGAEQEHFLIDKSYYHLRPDLVMAGCTLFGSLTNRNQQLNDHYFGKVPHRVLAFMQELDYELHRMGIPSKTRHNEVAPGQFEIAPIFSNANLSADHNQITMALIKDVAERHNFVALLHEKPFAGVNGSGKHLNWSMCDNTGRNLLSPGDRPESNYRFLAIVAIIIEAVHRHADAIRMSIAVHGNDHRLGGNEAPPGIISVFLGDTLTNIYQAIMSGKDFKSSDLGMIDLGANALVHVPKDNTDRNRTSPFAFTGNRFEFRACGSSQAIGFPLTVLNSAVAEVFHQSSDLLQGYLAQGMEQKQALLTLIKHWHKNSSAVVFNGDGYTDEWAKEAKKRKLPNIKSTPEALQILQDKNASKFMVDMGVFNFKELEMRFNVMLEHYNLHRQIEIRTLLDMVRQYVLPAAINYKGKLLTVVCNGQQAKIKTEVEKKLIDTLETLTTDLYLQHNKLQKLEDRWSDDQKVNGEMLANSALPMMRELASSCNQVESLIPDDLWGVPKYYDLLFIR